MHDQLSTANEAAAAARPPTDATYRDVQRTALRDLVTLATQCATTEADIQRRYHQSEEDANKEFEKGKWALEERYKKTRDTVAHEYQKRLEQITSQYESDVAAMNNAVKTARSRVQMEAKSADRDIKKEYDQAMWLAESVFDGTQARINDDLKKAKELASQQVRELEALEARAIGLIHRYNQDIPQVPAAAPAGEPPKPFGSEAAAGHVRMSEEAAGHLDRLSMLSAPKFFIGNRPLLAGPGVCLAAGLVAGLVQWAGPGGVIKPLPVIIAVGAAIVVAALVTWALSTAARRQVREVYIPLVAALDEARRATAEQLTNTSTQKELERAAATEKRKDEERLAKEKFAPVVAQATRNRDGALTAIQADFARKQPLIESQRDNLMGQLQKWREQAVVDMEQRHQHDVQAVAERHQRRLAEAQQRFEQEKGALERRLKEGLARTQAPMHDQESPQLLPWNDPAWQTWTPPKKFAAMVRFGQLEVDLGKIADSVPRKGELQLQLPPPFAVPTSLGFPRHASMLVQADRLGHDRAVSILQMVMARLLTSLPAGRVRFTIIDPVGLGQNFAGFMHLADHDEALVGGRIWTEAEHINQRLSDLTEHMETVIQKYLRNEFETIDDYNAQAGELAEPYRFLVVCDFPIGFEVDAFRRLASIASSGSRCGVYTLLFQDLRQALPGGMHIDELETHSIHLAADGETFSWKDPVFQQFPLTLDMPPAEEFLTKILDVVGRQAKESKRVEVPFRTIAPEPAELWSQSTAEDVRVPIGRMGATRLQYMRLGKGVAQHTLIAGKTGSGKSTLLHALVTNLAMWYSPDEVEFYLVDFKKGVEFKTYATEELPHARAIAVESDREFGISVLQRLDGELSRRGAIFRKLGVQDLPSYRLACTDVMPRTLLIIDEFQEFFSEDDKLAQDAGLLLDRLVRQGRAFGIHVILGSQTIGGTSGLSRSTIGQMAVRIALQTSEADSQLILGDGNSAARLLSRPGEAIYNDAGGLVENNSPFQIAWLPDEERERYLIDIRKRFIAPPPDGKKPLGAHSPAIVFEGNARADVTKNLHLAKLIDAHKYPASVTSPHAWLGEPVAIKEPTSVIFRRQSGSNMMVIGQQEEAAMAMMVTSVVSLACQQPPKSARFVVLDGCPTDSPLATVLPLMKTVLPHEVQLVEYRSVPDAMAELGEQLAQRQGGDDIHPPAIYLVIYGLQRYRSLRKQEESFSLSVDDAEKKPNPDKVFADLLREGPALGIHTIAWVDTAASIDRTIDRNGLREFDNRILFQMSAADSSNLIDSPLANKLGFYRALAYSEEQGVMEKFRPYALPDKTWLAALKEKLGRR